MTIAPEPTPDFDTSVLASRVVAVMPGPVNPTAVSTKPVVLMGEVLKSVLFLMCQTSTFLVFLFVFVFFLSAVAKIPCKL